MPAHPSPTSLRPALLRTALSAVLLAPVAAAQAEPIVGLLNGNRLTTFESATPGTASAPVNVTGLQPGANLVGIDLRPSTGVLYGLSQDGTLYTLNAGSGAASFVGSLTQTLGSGVIGIDFNPVPDLLGNPSLRIFSGSQNLRVNVNVNGAPVTNVDGALNGAISLLDGAAYTNNDRDPATGTALFGIFGGSLYRVTDPNLGLTALVGSLGVQTAEGATGFDISGLTGASFASLTAPGGQGFYSVNLGTGTATLIGAFGTPLGAVLDITAATGAPAVSAIPEPETYALMLLGLTAVGWAGRRRRRR